MDDLIGPIKEGQTPLIDLEDPPDWTRPEWFHDCPNEPHIDTPLHRGRLLLAVELAMEAITKYDLQRVADFGAGDGGLLEQLKLRFSGLDFWGYDLAQPSIDYAKKKRGIDIENRDVISTEPTWPELMITTEFLEHLVDPFTFLRRAREADVQCVVASSPFTETLENHYPLHTWAFDLAGYAELLEDAGFGIEKQKTVDMFQVCLGVAR